MSSGQTAASRIFAIRTTAGQESNVALLIERRCIAKKIPVKAIISPQDVSGYVFLETSGPNIVTIAIEDIKHVKGWVAGKVNFDDIQKFIKPKPVVEIVDVNDKVEIVAGPFKGMAAKVTRVDKSKSEVTLELLEAPYTLPITVHAEQVKLVSHGEAPKPEIKEVTEISEKEKKTDIFEAFEKLEEE
ncbi:MAG: transcription elongation factor Spt5 [Candidatus Methanomethyliaceae archaeon]|nr:transcription elongation factor Spt5 [Candidatus Methanomethyliaceae archaeon]